MADALTNPITATATQYRLDSIFLDMQTQNVAVQVSLLDAGGSVLKTLTFSDTWATVGIPPGAAASLKAFVVNYLKGRGTVN